MHQPSQSSFWRLLAPSSSTSLFLAPSNSSWLALIPPGFYHATATIARIPSQSRACSQLVPSLSPTCFPACPQLVLSLFRSLFPSLSPACFPACCFRELQLQSQRFPNLFLSLFPSLFSHLVSQLRFPACCHLNFQLVSNDVVQIVCPILFWGRRRYNCSWSKAPATVS